MRYAIITNPVSGKMSSDQKRSALSPAARVLDTDLYGLDTATAGEFVQCARTLASRSDVLVVAGGDGTFSEILNALDTRETPVAYLPLGSGNAMRYALGYRGGLAELALRIREGPIREYDLIDCEGRRRAFMASVGFEGTLLGLRDRRLTRGESGFRAYFLAFVEAYFRRHRRTGSKITIDGSIREIPRLLSLVVVKQPYFGYGMKVVPRAKFDDGKLHVLAVNCGLGGLILGGAASFTTGNRVGRYLTGRRVGLELDRPQTLQTDGNLAWTSGSFSFTLLPGALRIKC